MDHDLPDREEIACALDVLEVRLARQGQYDQAADVNSAKHLLRAADEEIARLAAERDAQKQTIGSLEDVSIAWMEKAKKAVAERDAAIQRAERDAINAYAIACGGDASARTISAARMRAVSAVERALERALVEACEGGRDE